MKEKNKKNSPGWTNFKKWYDKNRQRLINTFYESVIRSINVNINNGNLFQVSEEFETSDYENIFSELHSLEKIYIPMVIADYFYIKKLVKNDSIDVSLVDLNISENSTSEIKNGSNKNKLLDKRKMSKIGGAFYAERRVDHDSTMIEFANNVFEEKTALLKDVAFICAFKHDLEISEYEPDKVKIQISDKGIVSLKMYKDITKDQITIIMKDISELIIRANLEIPGMTSLLLHLIPVMIFVTVNLPRNEWALKEKEKISTNKTIRYILTAANELFGLDNINEYLEDRLKRVQMMFLLKSMDSVNKEQIERALTTKKFSDIKYKTMYNSIDQDVMNIYGENINYNSAGEIYEYIEFGDYTKLRWLFNQISSKGYNKNCIERSSPFRAISVFETLLDSVTVKYKEDNITAHFAFNRTANLLVFNQITKLYDALILTEVPDNFLIHWMDALLFKKALVDTEPEVCIKDIDKFNLFLFSIENIMSKDMKREPLLFELDPYEEYIKALHKQIIQPKTS